MEKIEFVSRIKELGLVGKTVKDLLHTNNSLYYKIYNYAEKNNLWLAILFIDLGLTLNRVDGLNSKERLDQFMKVYKYGGKDWYSIPCTHRRLIEMVLEDLKLSKEAFMLRYNISCISSSEKRMVYKSIEEIRGDLKRKNLMDSSIRDIQQFDSKTWSNIETFAKKNRYSMPDIWFAIGISYNPKIITTAKGMVKKDYVYHNEEEIIKDFLSKRLFGKTKKEVLNYDQGKTFGRVQKYADRENRSIQELWNILEVKSSEYKPVPLTFSSVDELSSIIKKRGLSGKTIKEFKTEAPDLYDQVKSWTRKNDSMKGIWSKIGIKRTIGFDSLDDILIQIKESGYSSALELRKKDWLFYRQISRFVGVQKNLTIKDVWTKAGLSFSLEGRPSKKCK